MTDTHTSPSRAKASTTGPADDAVVPGPDTSLATEAPPGREKRAAGTWTVYILLGVILGWIWYLDHDFVEAPTLMAFVKKAAPLLILAAGQYLVIVAGEFDLSVGSLVGAQVVIAAKLLDGEDSRTLAVLAVMVAFGLLIGLVNGVITTLFKVPSFIATLGMMMVLFGAVRLWTGGAPTGALSERFRTIGRGGIDTELWGLRQVPWSVLIAIAVGAIAVVVMRTSFGRTLLALGDNPTAARFSAVKVERTRIAAFVLSSLAATLAGILIGGFGGLTSRVGDGLEFTAITAVVLGGVVLGGGRGSVLAAMAGGLTLEAVFRLFRQFEWETTWQPTVQGVIIVAAVAYASWRPSLHVPPWPWRPTTPGSSDPSGGEPCDDVPPAP